MWCERSDLKLCVPMPMKRNESGRFLDWTGWALVFVHAFSVVVVVLDHDGRDERPRFEKDESVVVGIANGQRSLRETDEIGLPKECSPMQRLGGGSYGADVFRRRILNEAEYVNLAQRFIERDLTFQREVWRGLYKRDITLCENILAFTMAIGVHFNTTVQAFCRLRSKGKNQRINALINKE
jgi:hypothetical protein